MSELILAYLGPHYSWVMAFSLGLVIWKGKSVRKKHALLLLALTVTTFVLFWVIFVYSFPLYRKYGSAIDGLKHVLTAMAVICIGSSSIIGFWLIGKSLGIFRGRE